MLANELQVGLVDEVGWLKCVALRFIPHRSTRDAVQFIVYEGHEPAEGCFIASAPRHEQLRNVSRGVLLRNQSSV